MAIHEISALTLEGAVEIFNDLSAYDVDVVVDRIVLGDWVKSHVYIPDAEHESEITSAFMEAFLTIQTQLYQFVALVKTGAADSHQLSPLDKHDYAVSVRVNGGSSDLVARYSKQLEKALPQLLGKLTGRQAALVILGLAILISAPSMYSAWLESLRITRLEELKTKEHIEALQSLQFANRDLVELQKKTLDVIAQQGAVGVKAVDVVGRANEALLKAASKTERCIINKHELSQGDAELLRITPRKKTSEHYIIAKMRVVDINTSGATETMVLRDDGTMEEYRTPVPHNLFSQIDRPKLFESLDNHSAIWVEILIRQVDTEVRKVFFVRTVSEPSSGETVGLNDPQP